MAPTGCLIAWQLGLTTLTLHQNRKMRATLFVLGFAVFVPAVFYFQQTLPLAPPTAPKLIVDADMDVDDMWAIVLALSDPRFDVVGITVSPGWAHQWSGVPNAQRLVEAFARDPAAVPVAYGAPSQTQLVESVPTNLPPNKFLDPIDNYLINSVQLPASGRPPSSFKAHQLIIQRMKKLAVGETLDFLVTGSFSNLAMAMNADPDTFLNKIGTIFFAGAPLLDIENVYEKPPPHFQTPNYHNNSFPHTGWVPKGSCWNIFLDPISASQVLSSGVKLVAMSLDAQDSLHISKEDQDNIPLECQGTERADFAEKFTLQFGPDTKQTYADLRYWDPSAFLVAKEAIFGVPNGQHPICTEWKDLNLRVELDQAGGNYSWMVESAAHGSPVRACVAADRKAFLPAYWKEMACGVMRK